MKKSTKVKPLMEWKAYMNIGKEFVYTINDAGMTETYEGKELIDSDDLVMSIELCDGTKILLNGYFRVIFAKDCICIDVLCEVGN